MVKLNKCGHPVEWVIRLTGAGKRFHYCIGCIIEKLKLDNLEAYDNKFIQPWEKSIDITTEEIPPEKKKIEAKKSGRT